MKLLFLLFTTGFFFSLTSPLLFSFSKTDKVDIRLNENWKFHQEGDNKWHPASVPGCIHMDLYKNEIIGDPFYKSNEDSVQWIEKENWIYENKFKVSDETLTMDHIFLYFNGLDTYTDIFVNDSLVLKTDNMFREWRVECRDILKQGENRIKIKFYSPVIKDSVKASRLSYTLPDNRVFTRKAPYHYGWDWGPRFVTMGIWRPVVLKAWNQAVIEDLHIYQKKLTENRAFLTAYFQIQAIRSLNVDISLINEKINTVLADSVFSLKEGNNKFDMNFSIPDPQLWWCNGLGEQYLYSVKGELKLHGKTIDTINERMGIRSVEIVEEKDSVGSSFKVVLNGVPVFMKGANYIPQDSFLPRVTKKRYENIIQAAVEANMNMLRVWGGGIYENDLFYDLCDENGILVWQDFMFACAVYPGDTAFLENVEKEAVQNIKRLRNHPCIALWCGNNEIDEAWHNWGWQEQYGYSDKDSAEIWHNYLKIFHDVLPDAVKKFDPGRFYWPSSPKIGWGREQSLREGDCHYWGVWWGREPFSVYEEKVGRFMSEYGFQAIPSLKTIQKFTDSAGMNLQSESMQTHQKHPFGYELIKEYIERDYKVPGEFKSYIYISQLLQRDGIVKAIEAHRRAKPYCMGTLYWQLNDCWPVVSWSSVDYYGIWKALHYGVKNAYQDILISPVREDELIKVHIVSDKLESLTGELRLCLLTFSGECLWEKSVITDIQENSSKVYFSIPIDSLLKNGNKKEFVLTCSLHKEQQTIAENNFFFVSPKDLYLDNPDISYEVKRTSKGYSLDLTCTSLAKDIFLSVDNSDGFFTDNYFDLIPGERKTVEFRCEVPVKNFKDRLTVVSLTDINK
ncbi:MAG: glycoside hydrolase family 2 protein [bacterium]